MGHGRRPPGGWSGTRPCGTRSTRTGIKRRAAPLPARGVHRWAHGGPISDGNEFQLSLTKTVQKTFGKRLRAPALFMRTFNGRSCSCSRWMSTGPLLSVPLCFLLSLNKFGGCHVRAWMDGFELQLIKSRHLPEG